MSRSASCRLFLLLTALLAPAASRAADAAPRFDLERSEIRAFITTVSRNDDLPAGRVRDLLATAQPQPSIIEAMSRPAERTLPWWQYRARFLTRERIEAGVRFWAAHRERLERLGAEQGVPAHYLLAILGVETQYGRHTGRYRVLDALATLAFDYPPRSEYFRGELEQFLLMVRDGEADAAGARGSYAGAMGMPQFMPSSFRRLAVDGDDDGVRNLWSDPDDALASIANYFLASGWQRDEPVLAEVSEAPAVDQGGEDPAALRPLNLADTVGTLRARGFVFATPLAESAPAVLLAAEMPDGMGWRIGFRNFYAITRYNRSTRYAMAVHELAQALQAGMVRR